MAATEATTARSLRLDNAGCTARRSRPGRFTIARKAVPIFCGEITFPHVMIQNHQITLPLPPCYLCPACRSSKSVKYGPDPMDLSRDYHQRANPIPALFNPVPVFRIRMIGVEAEDFHFTFVLRIVVCRQFDAAYRKAEGAELPQYRR